MPLRPRPQKRVLNKKEPIDISTNIFTDDMITTVLNNTNKKIMALIKQLPEEVCSNDKYTCLWEVTKDELLSFFGISYARGLLGQNFLKLRRPFSVDVGHPTFSVSMSFNGFVFIKAKPSYLSMMLTRDKNDGEQTDLLHLEKYLTSSTNFALKTCLQMIMLQ